MKAPALFGALLLVFTACTTPLSKPRDTASDQNLGVELTADQKEYFINALTSTSWDDIEADLPRKLAPLGKFKPYFTMGELARTSYALVLESPGDMRRWQALAKLDSYAGGEYALPYEAAQREALIRNPRLFDHCREFQDLSDKMRPPVVQS